MDLRSLIVVGIVAVLVAVAVLSWIRAYAKEPRPREPWGGSRSSDAALGFWVTGGAFLGGGADFGGDDCGGDGGGD